MPPKINVSDISLAQLPDTLVFVSQDTAKAECPATVFIQRVVNTDGGLMNPKALRAKTIVNADTAQTEWGISGEIDSYSNAGSNGNTATSGVANKYGTASVFGGHFQANDHNKFASNLDVTSIVGAEMNVTAVGADHPTANGGYGNRYALDVIARTNESVPGSDDGTGNCGAAEIGVGIRVRSDNITGGRFRFGIAVIDQTGNPNPTMTGIRVNTRGNHALHMSGANSTAHMYSTGTPAYGAVFGGAYTSGSAIRLNAQSHIAFDGANSIRQGYGVSAGILGFYSGATERAGFDMTATPGLRIAGKRVVGPRAAALPPAATDLASALALINDMRAKLTAHGLFD